MEGTLQVAAKPGTESESQSAGAELALSSLKEWDRSFRLSPILALAQLVLSQGDSLHPLSVQSTIRRDAMIFNLQLKGIGPDGKYPGPMEDQKDSGRCWLFATTNVLRYHMMNGLNVEQFQISQSHLFFYDKLENANFYLENVMKTREEPMDSQIMLHLNRDPITDGGTWAMAINLAEKYGLIPHSLFPDSYSPKNTYRLNQIITSKIREYAILLRATPDRNLKAQFLAEVYNTLAIIMGTPPRPDEGIKWQYLDREGKCRCWEGTPVDFYNRYVKKEIIPKDFFNLTNDPRNEYEKLYTIERYGNVWGEREIQFVNAPISALEVAVITCIKGNTPIYFAADVDKSMSRPLGILDVDLYDIKSAYGFTYNMSKADRLRTGETSMAHAMVFTAVHLDAEGRPIRYKVENSWSEEAGDKGFLKGSS